MSHLHSTATTMLGGSLTRYHPPTMEGRGFKQDLVNLAGPAIVSSLKKGLESYGRGESVSEALQDAGDVLQQGLKRKIPAAIGLAMKNKVQQTYKNKRQRVKDILGV